MYRMQVKSHFDAAHYIRDYKGKCNRTHGHRWEVELVLEGNVLDSCNMLIDFSHVKSVLKDYLDKLYDHYSLNMTLNEPNVTAELLARKIYEDLKGRLPINPYLARVTIWENPECCVKYFEVSDESS